MKVTGCPCFSVSMQGLGEYIEPGGDSYKGDFLDDKCHGKGMFKFASGATYEGDWVDNKFHGQGKYTFPDGSFYEVPHNVIATSCALFFSDEARRLVGRGRVLLHYIFCPYGCHGYLVLSAQGAFEHNAFHGKGVFTDTEAHPWSGVFHNGSGPGLVNLL
jgi:hypothetical protein